ncbi:ATP-dependent helicase, partial [Nonomuraea sp. NPDC005983]
MLVVHGVWAGDGLAFWAESPDGAAGRAKGDAPRPHPFAAAPSAIAAHLGLAGGGPASAPRSAPDGPSSSPADPVPDGAAVRVLELLLPGSAGEPLPSPETGRLAETVRPRLRLWRVPAVVPPAAEALRVLDTHAGSATVRHWAAVAEFARDLVRRGRVVPQLVRDGASGPARESMWALPGNDARAVWRAVLTGADAAYFRELALAMPPACRTAQVERPSGEVLAEALGAFADALVRTALTEPIVARPRTPLDRWLAALTGADSGCPDVPELREELERWHESVTTSEGAATLCFRLVEPDTGDGARPRPDESDRWRVEFALQAADDPSLYVPAARVWAGEPVAGLPHRPERELLAG